MSTPATPAAIREMDLQLKGIGDETVKYSKWGRKTELHTLAKRSYQSDKPEEDDNWWKLSGARADIPGTPTCTLPVIIARLMTYIPIGGRRKNSLKYPFKIINEEGFLVKERLSVWIKKWMMRSNAEAEGFAHLLVAAPKTVYKISNYENYLPIQVKENYDQFIWKQTSNPVNEDTVEDFELKRKSSQYVIILIHKNRGLLGRKK